MNAHSIRGALCATALLLVAIHPSVQAQAPTPATSGAVARLAAERALVHARLADAGLTLAAGKSRLGAPVGGLATTSLKTSVARLAALRPGTVPGVLGRQLEFPRVRRAYETRAKGVVAMFEEIGVSAPEVFFRVFKRDQVLEVWARNRGTGSFRLLKTYPVCKLSGQMGPKRRQGDGQIPEGFYEIDLLNPQSNYHLSMRVDYPNAVDRAREGGRAPLGGDIYIHGGCATIGCVPVTDRWIEEIYLIALGARDAGQATIPVHLFPTRLDDAGMRWLARTYGTAFVDYPFWQNLREGYQLFETSRLVPGVAYDGARYTFRADESVGPAVPAAGAAAGR